MTNQPRTPAPAPGTVRPQGAHPDSTWCPTHAVWSIQCTGCRNDRQTAEDDATHARVTAFLDGIDRRY